MNVFNKSQVQNSTLISPPRWLGFGSFIYLPVRVCNYSKTDEWTFKKFFMLVGPDERKT